MNKNLAFNYLHLSFRIQCPGPIISCGDKYLFICTYFIIVVKC